MPRIPLLDLHLERLGCETGFFSGWEVPLRYTSAIEEHMNVRRDVGFFDVSHMGKISLKGPDAFPLIQYIYTRDMSKVKEYHMSGPTLALNEYARVKDDEMLYKIHDEEWLVVANAIATNKMIEYIENVVKGKGFRVKVMDLTHEYSIIALQGPRSIDVMESIGAKWAGDLKPLEFVTNVEISGSKLFLVSRSGWTGEDGFEIWGHHGEIKRFLEMLIEKGVKPAGLIARDTLRIEMGYVLNGQDYGEDPLKYPCAISLRYGMGAISWSKRGYVGEQMLRSYRIEGVKWVRMGLKLSKEAGKLFPRNGAGIYVENNMIGWITSGCYSPVLNRGIAMGYIRAEYAILGEEVEVDIRGNRYSAKVVDFPFININK
ncbi:MAG: glycine cleavage system aminomethyltransferase GcvT [Desulfurococcaceae archaeon]